MTFSAWLTAHYEEKGPVIWLAFFLELIAAVTLFLLMLLTCADVFGRYFFANSVDGTTELTEMAIAILVFAEMPVITWRGGHVVVDILDRVMGSSLIKVLGLFAAFLMSTSLYFLAVRIFQLAERSLRREEVTEYLQFPIGYVVQYIAIMSWITAALMISYGVYRLLFLSRD
ncbi:TRAP transporter small permease [Amphritea sp. 1_MG-2023]|uniref:TRAP transporter small permease n=1 Tax=Amphritea sp. 1_MG-2023 TaxID=3062670 RepID=UPI0026E2D282|nr:TRAP transporter small permease [Amphritea sp. 1_MG-2023]MDO6562470.1 TRAP transporter small permease [Amphritea sp. 1_MG-2023]